MQNRPESHAKKPRTASEKNTRAEAVRVILQSTYPDAHCELVHNNAFQLLCATILSAQCTDVRVNMVTPVLFQKYPTAEALAAADFGDLQNIIRSTGFFRSKAKNLILCAQKIVAEHSGQVPQSIESLAALPGVGRKTANVVLGDAFGKPAGVVVDTHVKRLSRRLGWTRHNDPVKIEKVLSSLFPPQHWVQLAHLLIWHGRRRCTARKPDCAQCEILHLCPTGQRREKKYPQRSYSR